MNKNLEKALFDIGKVDALMGAIESLYLCIEVDPDDREKASQGEYVFYSLWDEIKKLQEDLLNLEGDCRVVDAIYAVNDVKRIKKEKDN